MEKQKPHHSLHNDKFKHIGIDTSFIEKNANEYNDKIAPLYNGGKKDDTSISSVINRSANVRTVDTPVGQVVEPIVEKQEAEKQMESQSQQTVDIQQIEKMMDQKIYGLATKMQQYADETDNTIAALKRKVAMLEDKVASHHSSSTSHTHQTAQAQSEPQQTLASSGVQNTAPAAEPQKSTLEEDVAIDKMFDFSHNRTGKR